MIYKNLFTSRLRPSVLAWSFMMVALVFAKGSIISSAHAQTDDNSSVYISNIGQFAAEGSAANSAGNAIGDLCSQLASNAGSAPGIELICNSLLPESSAQIQYNATLQLTAEELGNQLNHIATASSNSSGVTGRLGNIRRGSGQGLSFNHIYNPDSVALGFSGLGYAASGDGEGESMTNSTFVSASSSDGERDNSEGGGTIDFSGTSFTIGRDHLINPKTIVGSAISYGRDKTFYANNGGKLVDRNLSLSIYASRQTASDWIVDGAFSWGWNDYLSERNISYTSNNTAISETAIGEPDGDQKTLSLGVGRTFLGRLKSDFSIRTTYSDSGIDRFTERASGNGNGSGAMLEIDNQSIESLTSDINIRVSKEIDRGFGQFVPYASLSWIHDFGLSSDNIRMRFAGDPLSENFAQTGGSGAAGFSTIFEVPVTETDRNFGNLNLGFTAMSNNGLDLTLYYSTLLGLDSVSYDRWTLNLRKDF